MCTLDVSFEFDASADAVWEILQDFGNVERWWPPNDAAFPLARVEVEGSGVGMVRKFYVGTATTPTCERLDYLDPGQRVLKLSIVGDAPTGLTSYQATGRVESLSEHRCRYWYRGEYITSPDSAEHTRSFLLAAYELLGRGIRQALVREGHSRSDRT